MILGGFRLYLYCDCKSCDGLGYQSKIQQEFMGWTYQEAANKAKAEGWKITRDKERSMSPKCKGRHYLTIKCD